MAAADYDESLRRLLADEGGYTNHPADPGGPTNYGITIFDYRKYVKPNATAEDVKNMKLAEAKGIYRAKYWDNQRCDSLPLGVDYATFDYGVNSGVGRSGKVLRRLLGLPDNTSVVTQEVILAASKRDPKALSAAICDERLRFLQSLRTWPTFGKGWGRRVAGVKAVSIRMAGGQAEVPAPTVIPTKGKGSAPINKNGQKGSAGGTVVAGGGAAATQHDPTVIIVILIVTVALAGFVWWFWHWKQKKDQNIVLPVSVIPEVTQVTQS